MQLTDVQRAWLEDFLGKPPATDANPPLHAKTPEPTNGQQPAAPAVSKPPPTKLPQPMLPDCKIVKGKVPGPANHVLCATHGHVVDTDTKMIIALNLEDYKKA